MDIGNINSSQAAPALRLVGGKSAEAGSEAGQVALRQSQSAEPAETASGQIEQAVSSLEAFTQSINRNLSFKLDDSTGRVVVKVTDSVSGEVIRQIPSEEALKLAASLDETRSLLFKAEV